MHFDDFPNIIEPFAVDRNTAIKLKLKTELDYENKNFYSGFEMSK